jgi:predicted RecA/RadA family phage recombinase
MAKAIQYVQKGESLTVTNADTPKAYLDVIVLGTRIGICGANASVGDPMAIHLDGVWELPSIATDSFDLGERLYWDAVAGKVTNVVKSVYAGTCAAAKLQAGATAMVKLEGAGATTDPEDVAAAATGGSQVLSIRARVTRADINTGGKIILPAVAAKKYRAVDVALIAYGGNAAATANATGIAISATQGTQAVKLFEVDNAQLTRSAINKPTSASTKILADGASFVQNDVNTGITLGAVAGTDLTTLTGADVIIWFCLED